MRHPVDLPEGIGLVPPDAVDVGVDKVDSTPYPTQGDLSARTVTSEEDVASFIPYPTAGSERQDPNVGASDIGTQQYLSPPEDPSLAYQIYQLSPYLSPHIKAMESNVYGAGFDLVLDDKLDCDEEVLERRVKRALQFSMSRGPMDVPDEPPENVVEEFIIKLKRRILWEEYYLHRFFSACCPDMDYGTLEIYNGQDLEITGNAYNEVLRDIGGNVARLNWAPSKHVRAVPVPYGEPRIGIIQRVRDPILGFSDEVQHRKFRTYALLAIDTNMVATYFKEFGDPRVLSRRTGKFYGVGLQGLQTLQQYEPGVLPATEILHYKIPFAGSMAYGKADWSGTHPVHEGSRNLDEENLKFISDEVLPSLLMLIAGPRIQKEERQRFEEQITNRARASGRGILLMNAYDQKVGIGKATISPQVHIEKLRSEQINEAIFGRYDLRAEAKSHMPWRMPGIAVGVIPERMDSKSAMMLNRFTEDQVYSPRRTWYDRQKNRLLDAMGIQCWRYRGRSLPPRDPESLAKIIEVLMTAGVLTPTEGRNLSEVIFNTRFSELPGVWAQLPTKLLIAVLQTKNPTLASALLLPNGSLSMERLSEVLRTGMQDAAAQVQGATDGSGEDGAGEDGAGEARPGTAGPNAPGLLGEGGDESPDDDGGGGEDD